MLNCGKNAHLNDYGQEKELYRVRKTCFLASDKIVD